MTSEIEGMVHIRTAAGPIEYRDNLPEWLNLIHEANSVAGERGHGKMAMFGAPDFLGEWWAGGSVEEYEHARVLHRGDETVSVVSKTDFGAEMLTEAATRLALQVSPVTTAYSLAQGND